MYAKIFEQIYEGTLVSQGPWQALVTFQQLLILADQEGIVDMTLDAIHRRTTIPVEILETGIEALMAPDPYSRTPDEEGRRIVLLSDHRPWGWRIVNYTKFRTLQREMDRREYHRKYYHQVRKQHDSTVSTISDKTQPIQPIAYAEANTKAVLKAKSENRAKSVEILSFLNAKTGRNYRPVKANLKLIEARLAQGYTIEQCRAVIAIKARKWATDPKMADYLRPATLFNDTKFNQYVADVPDAEESHADMS